MCNHAPILSYASYAVQYVSMGLLPVRLTEPPPMYNGTSGALKYTTSHTMAHS